VLHLITGGERSGKSGHAMRLALERTATPYYIATARRWDADFARRVDRHRAERDARWRTIEAEKSIRHLRLPGEVAVLDCVTLWLTNIYTDHGYDLQCSLDEARAEFANWPAVGCELFVVTNEVGMGVHAATTVGRKFVELQGLVNQYIAQAADTVTLMVSGLPVRIR
jgi:adenosylcobinamide kinase/adenosylcobinamide-phosphate guanylyltransferase